MNDLKHREFAQFLVDRLNALCQDPSIRKDIQSVLESRIPACNATNDHPELITMQDGKFGALGLINGILGGGWLITAHYSDEPSEVLTHFTVTQQDCTQ